MGKGKEKTTGPLQGLKVESQSSQQARHREAESGRFENSNWEASHTPEGGASRTSRDWSIFSLWIHETNKLYELDVRGPQTPRVEALTPRVAVCGEGAYREVTEVKLGHEGGAVMG